MSQHCALVDAGPLIAYYNSKDKHHKQICDYFKQCTFQLITVDTCITEVMYALRVNYAVQTSFLLDIHDGIWQRETLKQDDFARIAELNNKYKDIPGDFADLSLVVISERLDIPKIVTLDSDFDIYRRYKDGYFERVFYPKAL